MSEDWFCSQPGCEKMHSEHVRERTTPPASGSPAGVPEGWRLVPKVLTLEMRKAWTRKAAETTTIAWEGDYGPNLIECYDAMLGAAPSPPVPAQDVGEEDGDPIINGDGILEGLMAAYSDAVMNGDGRLGKYQLEYTLKKHDLALIDARDWQIIPETKQLRARVAELEAALSYQALASVREQEHAEIEALRAEVRSKSEQIDKLHCVCNEKAVLTNDLASARARIEALERQVREERQACANVVLRYHPDWRKGVSAPKPGMLFEDIAEAIRSRTTPND